jgi:hypothetical protein
VLGDTFAVDPRLRDPGSRSLARPKSSSFGLPIGVTRMFDGLRSRCTTSERCAKSTASQTARNRRKRASTSRPRSSAKSVIGSTVDALHREPGATVGRDAAVEEAGDGGMLEAGEELPLDGEAGDDLAARHAGTHQLHRGALGEAALDALRRPDLAHPAGAELFPQPPGAEALGGRRLHDSHRRAVGDRRPRRPRRAALDRTLRLAIERQQAFDVGGERRSSDARRTSAARRSGSPSSQSSVKRRARRSTGVSGAGHRESAILPRRSPGCPGRRSGATMHGEMSEFDPSAKAPDAGAVTRLLAAARDGDSAAPGEALRDRLRRPARAGRAPRARGAQRRAVGDLAGARGVLCASPSAATCRTTTAPTSSPSRRAPCARS